MSFSKNLFNFVRPALLSVLAVPFLFPDTVPSQVEARQDKAIYSDFPIAISETTVTPEPVVGQEVTFEVASGGLPASEPVRFRSETGGQAL